MSGSLLAVLVLFPGRLRLLLASVGVVAMSVWILWIAFYRLIGAVRRCILYFVPYRGLYDRFCWFFSISCFFLLTDKAWWVIASARSSVFFLSLGAAGAIFYHRSHYLSQYLLGECLLDCSDCDWMAISA